MEEKVQRRYCVVCQTLVTFVDFFLACSSTNRVLRSHKLWVSFVILLAAPAPHPACSSPLHRLEKSPVLRNVSRRKWFFLNIPFYGRAGGTTILHSGMCQFQLGMWGAQLMVTGSVDQDLARVNQDLPEHHQHEGWMVTLG